MQNSTEPAVEGERGGVCRPRKRREQGETGAEGGAGTDPKGSERGLLTAPCPYTHAHLGHFDSRFPEDRLGAGLPSRSLESLERRPPTS